MSTERSSDESLVRNRVEGEWKQFKESLDVSQNMNLIYVGKLCTLLVQELTQRKQSFLTLKFTQLLQFHYFFWSPQCHCKEGRVNIKTIKGKKIKAWIYENQNH